MTKQRWIKSPAWASERPWKQYCISGAVVIQIVSCLEHHPLGHALERHYCGAVDHPFCPTHLCRYFSWPGSWETVVKISLMSSQSIFCNFAFSAFHAAKTLSLTYVSYISNGLDESCVAILSEVVIQTHPVSNTLFFQKSLQYTLLTITQYTLLTIM
jgi:hypothetical protein